MGSHVRAEFYFLFFNEKNYAGRPSREYRPWRIFVFELKKNKAGWPSRSWCAPFAKCPNPGHPNDLKVRFRPGLHSSGCNRPGFRLGGSFRRTSTNSGFKMDIFLIKKEGPALPVSSCSLCPTRTLRHTCF